MKKKQILLTVTLFILTFIVNAQDQYEFMIIEYNTAYRGNWLSISIDGNLFSEEEVELQKKENSSSNANPLLKKTKEFQDKGWEVMTMNAQALGGGMAVREVYFAYLRKKKTDKK